MPSVSRKHNLEWSPAEVRRMRALARKRISARVAASKLGRSPGAVRYKAMMEGVSFRSINRRPVRRSLIAS
jgi:hypothetical protein